MSSLPKMSSNISSLSFSIGSPYPSTKPKPLYSTTSNLLNNILFTSFSLITLPSSGVHILLCQSILIIMMVMSIKLHLLLLLQIAPTRPYRASALICFTSHDGHIVRPLSSSPLSFPPYPYGQVQHFKTTTKLLSSTLTATLATLPAGELDSQKSIYPQ